VGSSGTTNTAALVFGGGPPAPGATESWDGTSWTEVADLATARSSAFSAGTSTTALAAGADPASINSNRRMECTNSKLYTNSELIWQIIKT
jgi:hypothetical protein